jgi:serine/threonine protein kinase
MSGDGHASENSLDATQYGEVDRICLAFEQAWLNDQSPKLAAFLQPFQGPLAVRSVLFRELLALELHYQRRNQSEPDPATYLRRFPEFADVIPQLFHESGAVALDHGESPKPAARDTKRRFGDPTSSTSRSEQQPTQAEPTPPPVQRPQRLGRYQILRSLGKGAFGEVYLAKDPQLDRLVAIKVCREDAFSSQENAAIFLNEARKAAQVSRHPGIVTIHNVGRTDGRYYIVMDYVEGGTLAAWPAARKLSFAEKAELIAKVADAVHYAHTRGLVHRDMKPANILIDLDGTPQVADFGLALHESEQDFKRGEVSGTPYYMSPEQATGHTERLDGRTDIWSLGATLYELLTGRRPFSGSTTDEVFDQIQHRDVKPPRQIDDTIPVTLERVCLDTLQKQPSMRPSTARDLAAELRKAVGRPQADASTAPQTARSGKPWSHPSLILVLVATLAVIVLGGLAGVYFSSGPSSVELDPKGPESTPRDDNEVPPPAQFVKLMAELGNESHHPSGITAIFFASSPAGEFAATGDEGGRVCLWDMEGGKPLGSYEVDGPVWRIALSRSANRIVTLLNADRTPDVRSFPDLKPQLASSDTVEPPTAVEVVEEGIVTFTAHPQGLQWRRISQDTLGAFVSGTPWQWVVTAEADGCIVAAGYTRDRGWLLYKGRLAPRELREQVSFIPGPVYHVAISRSGRVVVGGFAGGVGIQVCDSSGILPLLDVDSESEGPWGRHHVAISPDGNYVYAVSRRASTKDRQSRVRLRAWFVGDEHPQHEQGQLLDEQDIPGPLEAVAFHTPSRRVMLAIGRVLSVWRIPGEEIALSSAGE